MTREEIAKVDEYNVTFNYITDTNIRREKTIQVKATSIQQARYRAGMLFRKEYATLRLS